MVEFLRLSHSVVHCQTEEDSIKFFKELKKQDPRFTKIANQYINESNWSYYKEQTCYRICSNSVGYSPIDYYKDWGYSIIESTIVIHDCESCDVYNTCNKERCLK